jgi:AcrR family transcriptional regulator
MPAGAKPAVQARSRETRDRLLAALDVLLKEKSFEAVTVTEIARRAGVSAASIYQRFDNRDAAIAILIELYMRRVAAWSGSPEGAVDIRTAGSLWQALERVALGAWRQFDALGYLMRPAYLYSRLRPDLVGEQWAMLQAQAVQGFRSLLAAFPGELGDRDPDRTAGTVAYVFNMMFLGRLLHADEAGASVAAEAFAVELADLVCGYLAFRRPGAETRKAGP